MLYHLQDEYLFIYFDSGFESYGCVHISILHQSLPRN